MKRNHFKGTGPVAVQGKGTFGRHITKRITRNGRVREYHATKGWRNYREPV